MQDTDDVDLLLDVMVEWGYSDLYLLSLDIGELYHRYKIAESRRASRNEMQRQMSRR